MELEGAACLSSGNAQAVLLNLGYNGYVGDLYRKVDHGSYIEYIKHERREVSRETKGEGVSGEKRGRVEGMSWDSRKRLLRVCFSLEWSGAVLVTLTARDSPTYADLRAFMKRLTRKNRGLSALWVMELQRRGAVHYHVAVFGGNSYIAPQRDLQAAWEAVLGVDLAILDVRRCDAGGGLYIAKYVSKGGVAQGRSLDNMPITGRRWGILNRANLPVRADHDEKGRVVGLVTAEERWRTPGVAGFVLTLGQNCHTLAETVSDGVS